MREIPFDRIRQSISDLAKVSNVRAVFVCQISGNILVKSGLDNEVEESVLRQIAPSVLPATRRIAEKLGNPNESQLLSLPDDNLHLLVSWLADEYFLVVSFSQPVNPYSPPQSVIKTCDLLRYILQSE